MDRNWLLVGTLDSGVGARGVLAGLPLDEWPVTLHRVDDRIQFIRRQVEFRSARSPEVGKELSRCFTDSVWASLKIESKPHPERKSVLVDAGPLFLGDLFGVGRWLTGALGAPYRLDGERTSYKGEAQEAR